MIPCEKCHRLLCSCITSSESRDVSEIRDGRDEVLRRSFTGVAPFTGGDPFTHYRSALRTVTAELQLATAILGDVVRARREHFNDDDPRWAPIDKAIEDYFDISKENH